MEGVMAPRSRGRKREGRSRGPLSRRRSARFYASVSAADPSAQ